MFYRCACWFPLHLGRSKGAAGAGRTSHCIETVGTAAEADTVLPDLTVDAASGKRKKPPAAAASSSGSGGPAPVGKRQRLQGKFRAPPSSSGRTPMRSLTELFNITSASNAAARRAKRQESGIKKSNR